MINAVDFISAIEYSQDSFSFQLISRDYEKDFREIVKLFLPQDTKIPDVFRQHNNLCSKRLVAVWPSELNDAIQRRGLKPDAVLHLGIISMLPDYEGQTVYIYAFQDVVA